MCGICGFAGTALGAEAAHDAIGRMCDAIRHRGPDDAGVLAGPGLGLGMRRLSIIDVGGGHQPIGNEDGRVQIVFNGEIYNHHELRRDLERKGHVFRTHCDTECIVHLYEEYGDACVTHLRGMFAFAIWDAPRERLFVARDRLGIKPLSYRVDGEGVVVCSELRSLLAYGGSLAIDPRAVAAYLTFGYVPDPQTIFVGVRKLPPGHWLSWTRAGGIVVRPYWTPAVPEVRGIDEEEAVRELRRLLESAVTSHLESEVPLGAFLSGGLDSSTVVALMRRAGIERVRTFAIGFDEADVNEAPYAREVAEALGTEHTELVVRPDVDALFEGLIAAFDEPFADSSAIPTYLVAQLARRQVTVALSGDGGDELFGGYTRYFDLLERRELPAPVRGVVGPLGAALPHAVPGRNRLCDLGRSRRGRYATTVAMPAHEREGGVMLPELADAMGRFDTVLDPWFGVAEGRDFGTQMTLVDIQSYLPGDILTKVDRTSMAVSLEARVPLLDHPLVEFALSLPASLKFRERRGKHLFRRAIEPWVPPMVLQRRKQGFAVPLDRWFRRELRHRLEALQRPEAPVYAYVRRDAVRRVVDEHLRGRRDHSALIWRLLVLDVWLGHLAAGRIGEPTSNPLGRSSAVVAGAVA